jgi:hypothetical protein
MVSQDLEVHSSKLFVLERRKYTLIVFGKNAFKKKKEWLTEKYYYQEMKINP